MKQFAIWLGLAIIATLVYLGVGATASPPGFPVDDGWIHQVFARNLATRFEFSYNPGVPVAASTSPLWTFLLVPGHWLPNFYLIWTYAVGVVFLALTAREVYLLATRFSGDERLGWAASLFILFEWRLVWAAASGMETLLFAWATLFFVRSYELRATSFKPENSRQLSVDSNQLDKSSEASSFILHPSSFKDQSSIFNLQSSILLGATGGLLMWIRPEGIFLAALAGLDLLWRGRRELKTTTRTLVWYALGGMLSVLPYFGFNYLLSGGILPTTFSAKGNYYAGVSVLGYLWDAFTTLIVFSPLLALVPGFLVAVGSRSRKTDLRPLVWVVLLLGLYAWRLPVTYHHARYLMPLIPFLVIYGVLGTQQIRLWLRARKLPIVARAVPFLVALVLIISWLNNSGAYRADVRYINDQHVAAGNWLAQNSPPQAVVATHDVGAITFFGRRRLVDTAGLISPEFALSVRDEAAILQKVREAGANYFSFLPTWYGSMEGRLVGSPKVFEAQADYLAQFGERNMVIYVLR
jgi:hypothetical protein